MELLAALLMCVPLPLYSPACPPAIERMSQDGWHAQRIGPVVTAAGDDFKLEAEHRGDHWRLHWWFNGKYAHSHSLKEMPALLELFGK